MTESIREIYDRFNSAGGPLDQLQQQYGIFNGNGQSDFNAVAHAYTSAGIAYQHGESWANIYGEGREAQSRVGTLFGEGRLQTEGESRDGLRDIFNNRVGNQIANYARENNLPESAMADLVGDALARGLLIVNEFRDSRIIDYRMGTHLGLAQAIYDGPSADVARAIELKLGLPFGTLSIGTLTDEGVRTYFESLLTSPRPMPRPDECFLAGTQVSMWDGTKKPIEQVEAGDIVVSYDKDGNLKPGRVKRTMTNRAKQILDVHGLMVTPGHATLCGDGRFNGQHVPILDILRSDGALVREDGTKIRAGTGCRLGTMGDRMITAIIGKQQLGGLVRIAEVGEIRAGTRFITEDGEDVSVLDMILNSGGHLTEDGMIQTSTNGPKMPFRWTFTSSLPKPEDYVLQRSATHLQDIYQANEWESVRPSMPIPMGGEAGATISKHPTIVAAAPVNVPLALRNRPDAPQMSRKYRRAAEANARKKGGMVH